MNIPDDLVLVLPRGVCQGCGESFSPLYHHRLSRGPLACLDCWRRMLEAQKEEENGELSAKKPVGRKS